MCAMSEGLFGRRGAHDIAEKEGGAGVHIRQKESTGE